jgi:diacylglycerol kinase (ATP)
LLPIGTANNIARTAAALGDARQLIGSWRSAKAEPFDVGVVSTSSGRRLFVEGAGGGLFADLIADGSRHVERAGSIVGSETDRALAFLRGLVDKAQPRHWRVKLDGEDHSGDYVAVEAMNIRHAGPSVPIAPDADPADGMLDVVFVSADDCHSLLQYLDKRLEQHEVRLPALTVRRARQVSLTPSGGRLRIDDEIVKGNRRVDISLMAGAAHLLRSGRP